jgi:hypothetical protein
MSVSTETAGERPAAGALGLPWIITASSVGTLIEWYDFYLYGVLALFFSRHFFSPEPALDAWTAAKDRNDPRVAPLAASPSGSLPGHSNGTSLVSLELRPRSVTTDSRLVTQADRSDAGRDVETGAAFETERLKRDRSAGTADQHIGPGSNPDRGACGCAGKFARQRARRQIGGRCKHPPNEHTASCIADIDPESPNTAGIIFGTARRGRKGAAERPR